jgi:predicted DNA-binding transcriptional regulator AlpA
MDDRRRWLKAEDLATYAGVRIDYLRRYVKAGKLPAPSYHLGPRSPRWDKEAVDALFAGAQYRHARSVTTEQVVAEILAGRFGRRPKLRPSLAETELGRGQPATIMARKKRPTG